MAYHKLITQSGIYYIHSDRYEKVLLMASEPNPQQLNSRILAQNADFALTPTLAPMKIRQPYDKLFEGYLQSEGHSLTVIATH